MKVKVTENTVDDAMNVVISELQISKLAKFAGPVGKANVQSHFLQTIDSKGRKWDKLSDFTINELREHGGTKPLQDSGQLLISVTDRETSKGVNIEAARGFTAKRQNIAETLNKGGLLWSIKFGRNIKVPPREFSYIDQDGKELIENHAKTIAKKAKR